MFPLLLALACAREADSGARTEVEFWALGREGELVRELVPEFERRHPELSVRVQQIPWSAAREKLLTAFAGRALPDAIQLGSTWIPELVALGALERLDARIAASAAVRREDYFPGLFELGVVAGETWAVPWYADTRLLFYRRDLFETAGWPRAPRTWAEWTRALGDVRRSHPGSHPILLPLSEWEVPVILAFQRGADLLRDGDRFGDFTSPAFRSAFDFYQGFFREGLAPRRGAAEIGNLHQDFAVGTFACFVSGPWNLAELARRLPPELQERWDTAPLPAPEGAEAPGLSLAAGAGLVLVRSSPRHAEAWRWIEFLSAPEVQAAFHAISGDLPARRSAWSDPRLADSPHAQAFRAQLDRVRPPPRIPEWERIASRISRHAEAVVRGSESVEAALASLDRETDRVLEKRRWLLEREALAGDP